MKVPKGGICVYLFPDITHSRNRSVHQGKFFNLSWKLCGIRIRHHQPNVVPDKIDIFVSEASDKLMDIEGCSLLVITGLFSRRLAQAAQIRSNYCVIFAEVSKERKPHSCIVTEPVNQHHRQLAPAGLEVMNAHTIHVCEK